MNSIQTLFSSSIKTLELNLKIAELNLSQKKLGGTDTTYNNTHLYTSTTTIVDETIEFSCLLEAC